jgi:hypothetical protein
VYQDFTLLGCSYPSIRLHACHITKDEDIIVILFTVRTFRCHAQVFL